MGITSRAGVDEAGTVLYRAWAGLEAVKRARNNHLGSFATTTSLGARCFCARAGWRLDISYESGFHVWGSATRLCG